MKNKTLLIYQVFEKNRLFKNNIELFLKSIVYLNHTEVMILLAGQTTIEYPQLNNIKYVFLTNEGYDHGSYAKLLSFYKIQKKIKYVVFLNSSVMGPFTDFTKDWITLFTKQLDNNIRLVGSSINDYRINNDFKLYYPHVQSYFFVLNLTTLEYLINKGLFNEIYLDRDKVISNFEIKMSQLILSESWKISSIIKEQQIDYTIQNYKINPSSKFGDPLYSKGFYERTLTPQELIFIKPERNMYSYFKLIRTMEKINPQTIKVVSNINILVNSIKILITTLTTKIKELVSLWILE
jgi:hypothetical protein